MSENDRPTVQTTPVEINKSKKRKHDPPDLEYAELKSQAKYHCKNIEEYRKVSKLSKEKLELFLSDSVYFDSVEMMQKASVYVHELYSLILDTCGKGDGFVKEQLMSDMSLRNAIQKELLQYSQYLTNRAQIFIFTLTDCIEGKKRQQASIRNNEPRIIEVPNSEYNVNEHDNRNSPTVVEPNGSDECAWNCPAGAEDGNERNTSDQSEII